MYRNRRGTFEDVTAQLGPAMLTPRVGRAAAFADFDNDGDLDVLVTNNGQEPQLLRNDGGNRNHWLQLRLVGVRSNRDDLAPQRALPASTHRWKTSTFTSGQRPSQGMVPARSWSRMASAWRLTSS